MVPYESCGERFYSLYDHSDHPAIECYRNRIASLEKRLEEAEEVILYVGTRLYLDGDDRYWARDGDDSFAAADAYIVEHGLVPEEVEGEE